MVYIYKLIFHLTCLYSVSIFILSLIYHSSCMLFLVLVAEILRLIDIVKGRGRTDFLDREKKTFQTSTFNHGAVNGVNGAYD